MAGFGNLLAERTVETGKRSVTVAQNPQIAEPVFRLADVNVYYGDFRAVRDVTLDVTAHQITALIGPSGCGKSTLIRSLNRMNDLIPGARVEGKVLYHEQDLYDPAVDPVAVRRRIGMVFQRPNPFPKSIYENIAFGLKVNGLTDDIDDRIEHALKAAALWDEVKANLKKSAYDLSGGQQQRLCIARAVAVEPDVILMDEPCSALDPIATLKIEDLMQELKKNYTIVIVTHNMQQAARASDFTGFFWLGELVEHGPTQEVFLRPKNGQTEDYITGRFG